MAGQESQASESPSASPGNKQPVSEKAMDTQDTAPPPPPYCALSSARRRFVLILVTIAGLLGPLAGAIYLPALPILQKEFKTSATVINATVSVFMVTFAFAPLFWASFADFKGRRPLYITSLIIYIVANVLLAALPRNLGALFFLRIVQAFGSAAVVSMGAGTVADITEPKRRGSAMSIFLLGPQCGPVLGPVIGGALAQASTWRWIFGFLALSGFVVWLIIVFMLPETLRFRVGNCRIYSKGSWILLPPSPVSQLAPQEERGPHPPKPTLIGYWRLFSYPPIGIVSCNTAMLYATYFAIAVNLPQSLEKVYHWSSAAVGGGYVAIGVALIVGSIIGGRANDWRRARMIKATEIEHPEPETRLVDQIWGVLLCCAGTLMYGWFVDKAIHPAAVLVATFLAGFGMSWVFVATSAFLSECVPQQAAGAFALGNMLRNPAAAIAAVILPTLIRKMGIGWFFTGMALLDFVLVGGAVIVLRIRSPHWRKQRQAKMAAR